jgi:hypothetical protein
MEYATNQELERKHLFENLDGLNDLLQESLRPA